MNHIQSIYNGFMDIFSNAHDWQALSLINDLFLVQFKKVQVGKDQEKAQSEKDSHSKNRGGKKPNQQSGTYTMKTFRKPNEQLFSQ